jgi:hypothetical protein
VAAKYCLAVEDGAFEKKFRLFLTAASCVCKKQINWYFLNCQNFCPKNLKKLAGKREHKIDPWLSN